jgi:hypothetical protein
MAFSNTIQLTTFCDIFATPAETSVFRLSSVSSTWRSTLPLEPSTFLWQISSPSTGSWNNFTTWTTTTSFLLTSTEFDNSNFRLLENRKNSTISLTSVSNIFPRRYTFQSLPSSDNIELWLDATKGLYNGLSALSSDNSSVALWSDLSRKERNPTQSVVNNFPTLRTNVQNGNNVLRFNGTSQFLEILNSTATFKFLHDGTQYTVFIVAKAGETANPTKIHGFIGNNAYATVYRGSSFFYDDQLANNAAGVYVGNGNFTNTASWVSYVIRNDTYPPNQYTLTTYIIQPAAAPVSDRTTIYTNITGGPYQDNIYTATPSTANATFNLQVGTAGGSSWYLLGDLCEIIIYRGILQTSERQTVENYLKSKWGTP